MNPTASLIAGLLFLAAIAAYASGNHLIAPLLHAGLEWPDLAQQKSHVQLGALLMLANSLLILVLSTLLHAAMKPQQAVLATLYLSLRIAESVLLAFGVVALLAALSLYGNTLAAAQMESRSVLVNGLLNLNYFGYQVAMICLGLGSIALCRCLPQMLGMPRWLAAAGAVAYLLLAAGAVSEICDGGNGLLLALPGAAFEAILAIWLIYAGLIRRHNPPLTPTA